MSPPRHRPLLLLLPSLRAIATTNAHAAPPASVDWARGLVIADGIGLADRHAPNPAVARGTSRRTAEGAAKKTLADKLGELPVAGGGTVGAKAKGDAQVKARLARAVDHAVTLAAEPETDGSWRVTLAVPIEAVRQAIVGPRVIAATADDKGPAVVVVDGVAAKPAVGWKVAGLDAPTLWVTTEPAWAKDAPHVTAKSAKSGAIDASAPAPASAAGPSVMTSSGATLFVIVTKP
jgi:hypothetical protein